MNTLVFISGCLLLATFWAVWSRTRFGRSRARLRRLYAQQELTASVTSPRETEPAPASDDRQMHLFTDLPQATLPVSANASATRPPHPLRRRTDRPASERLDWQYFNKDSGDLAYPAAKDRRKPAAATAAPPSLPQRRA